MAAAECWRHISNDREIEAMKTAIVYYSQHHGNTRKLLDAITEKNEVTLIDVVRDKDADISEYDRIGFASGIYFSNFAKQILEYAETVLPQGKDVFYIATCGANPTDSFFKGIRNITDEKGCKFLGQYICTGYDTFGPFKLVGGLKKGHPDADEILGAVKFYESL